MLSVIPEDPDIPDIPEDPGLPEHPVIRGRLRGHSEVAHLFRRQSALGHQSSKRGLVRSAMVWSGIWVPSAKTRADS